MESLGGGRIVESRWSGGGEGEPERVGQRKMRWRASTGGWVGKNGRQEKFIRGGGRRGSGVGEEEDEKGEERVNM